MALTITESVGDYGLVNKCIALPHEIVFDVTFSASMLNRYVFWNFALWLRDSQIYLAGSSSDVLERGWMYYHDGTSGYQQMYLRPGSYSDQWENVSMYIRFTSTTAAKIKIQFQHTMDMNAWLDQEKAILNSRRLFHYRWNNPVEKDLSGTTVYKVTYYSADSRYIGLIVQASTDGDTVDEQSSYALGPFQNNPWNPNVLWSDESWTITRSANPVATLSPLYDTDFEFRATFNGEGVGTAIAEYFVGMVRIDPGPDEDTYFWDDLPEYIGQVTGSNAYGAWNNLPEGDGTTDLIDTCELLAVDGSPEYALTFTINKELCVPGATYRVFVIIQSTYPDVGTVNEPYHTIDLYVPDEQPPLEFDPDAIIRVYHSDDPEEEGSCFTGLVPGERIYAKSIINKADYNDAIAAAGISGDYNTNFQNVEAYFVKMQPIGMFIGQNIWDVDSLQYSGSGDDGIATVITKTNSQWEGVFRYLVIKWEFFHDGQTDYIVHVFSCQFLAEDTVKFLTGTWSVDGQDVSELCNDLDDSQELVLTNTVDADGWYIYAMMIRDGYRFSEYDADDSDNMEDLLQLPIVEMTDVDSGIKTISTILKYGALQEGDCVRVMVKQAYAQDDPDACSNGATGTLTWKALAPFGIKFVWELELTMPGGVTLVEGTIASLINSDTEFTDFDYPESNGVHLHKKGFADDGPWEVIIVIAYMDSEGCIYQLQINAVAEDGEEYVTPLTF